MNSYAKLVGGYRRVVSLPAAVFVSVIAILAFAATPAFAGTGWYVTSTAYPTDLPPGGEGGIEIAVMNIGETPSAGPVTVTDTLPPGVIATQAGDLQYGEGSEKIGEDELWDCSIVPGVKANSVVTCTNTGLPSIPRVREGLYHDLLEYIGLQLHVAPGVSGTLENAVTVSGGGASGPASFSEPIVFSSQPAGGYGIQGADVWFSNADGTVDTQGGSHPYEAGFNFHFNTVVNKAGELLPAGGSIRNLEVRLPPGFVGNVTAVPQCTRAQFALQECPIGSRIGTDGVLLQNDSCCGHTAFPGAKFATQVYNMVPPPGVAAQFAFNIDGRATFLDAIVRSGGDYGITIHTDNIQEEFSVDGNQIVFWGEPANPSHNFERCPVGSTELDSCASGERVKPYLTLGTSCEGAQAQSYSANMTTWLNAKPVGTGYFEDNAAGTTPVGLTGCANLAFGPSLTISPDTTQGETPAGLTSEVKVDQAGLVTPEATAPSALREATVTLPEGLVINPGRATGLQACAPAQSGLHSGEAFGDEGPSSCPLASQIGTVEIKTPLLPDTLEGDVYLLESTPPHVKIMIAASADGVNVKLEGDVELCESAGQVIDGKTCESPGQQIARFPETPPVPFTSFKLAFSGGGQAALYTPTQCRDQTPEHPGAYETSADFQPWATPFVENTLESSGFAIDAGPDGGPCLPSTLPFTPELIAGSTTDQAGGFTDFSLLLRRSDGQQRIDGLQFKAPEGLTGELAKVPLCTNAQAETNTCPEASKIGHTVVGAGPGADPLYIPVAGQEPAPIYLTESYDGAPFGLSIVVPLDVGPFTLPTQRVRAKIEVNPITSALTVTTNPLPQVVAGVPTDLRTVDAVIERPEFMVNPTNCNPSEFSGTAYGTAPVGQNGAGGVGAIESEAHISSHFQVGSCRSLEFTPKFTASTEGRTSKSDGASLILKVQRETGPSSNQANFAEAKIELPKALPSRLTTLQRACLAATFEANPASCPPESDIGYVKVITPVLPVPLEGPAYFVSHGGEAFPSVIFVLQGYGVTIDVVSTTFISKAGITSATIKTVPDDPFSSFELVFPEKPFSALGTNKNLCALTHTVTTKRTVKEKVKEKVHGKTVTVTKKVVKKTTKTEPESLKMPTEFVAQNGIQIHQVTPVTVTGCPKVVAKKAAKKKKKGKKRK